VRLTQEVVHSEGVKSQEFRAVPDKMGVLGGRACVSTCGLGRQRDVPS
jgi:hypothetical protein